MFGIAWFFIMAYAIEYLDFKKKISSLMRIVLEVLLIVSLLLYPILLQYVFKISFGSRT